MPHHYALSTSLHNFAGDFFQNIFHYELSEGGTADAYEYAEALAEKWAATNVTDYLDLFGNDVILDFCSAKRIDGLGGPSATIIIAQPGTGPQMSISAGVAADIAWHANNATNRAGHSYIAAPYDGALSGGQWTTIFAGKVASFIGAQLVQLVLAGALGNADFGIWTRKLTQFNKAKSGLLKPKPTMLNKRTLPIL